LSQSRRGQFLLTYAPCAARAPEHMILYLGVVGTMDHVISPPSPHATQHTGRQEEKQDKADWILHGHGSWVSETAQLQFVHGHQWWGG